MLSFLQIARHRILYTTLDKPKLLNLDPAFDKTIQLQVPKTDKNIAMDQLPNLNPNATFILSAPGATLDATQTEKCDYNNNLHFVGERYVQNGQKSFKRGCFDVESMEVSGGESNLQLREGGAVQAKKFSNEGHMNSDGIIFWNVDEFTNDVQIKEYLKYYIHSWQTFVTDEHPDQVIVERSGSIHAAGHTGYIGQLNETGGKLTSGVGGNHLYIKDANLKPIFSLESQYTRGIVEEIGCSWHAMPKSHEAEIGSSGVNNLLGTGRLDSTGSKIWGDEGNHVHFNEGVHKNVESSSFVIQEAKRKHRRRKEVVVPRTEGYVYSSNDISSNNGPLSVAASDGSVNLTNTTVSCPGDAAFIAREDVTINGQERTYHQSFSLTQHSLLGKKKVHSQSQVTEIDSSYLFIGGNLLVSCLEFNLNAVSGVVGDLDITALTTRLSGKEERFLNQTTTQSFSIGLPTDNLVNILSNHNAKAIFSAMVQNCGWEPAELDALVHAKSIEEIPGHLLTTAKNIWDVTAFVAAACNEIGEGNPGEFVGGITDRLGLTTVDAQGKRSLSSKVHLNWSKTKEQSEHSKTIASNLYVGGTFKLFGNKLLISGGSKIDAKDLVIALAEGIEMTSGKEKYEYSKTTKNASVGISLLNPEDVDVSASKNQHNIQSETHQLAALNARENVHIKAKEYIRGEGKITGKTGEVSAPEISLNSPQNTYHERQKTVGASVSTNLSSLQDAMQGTAGVQYAKSNISSVTTEDKACIDIQDGSVRTNHAHLANGSQIHAKQLLREDGEEGLPTVTGTQAQDHTYSSQKGFSIQGSNLTGEFYGKGKQVSDKQNVVHKPSVYAENVSPGSLDGINTEPDQERSVTRSSQRAFSAAVYKPNEAKLQAQTDDILTAGRNIGEAVKRGMHFIYPTKDNPSKDQNNGEAIVDQENHVKKATDFAENPEVTQGSLEELLAYGQNQELQDQSEGEMTQEAAEIISPTLLVQLEEYLQAKQADAEALKWELGSHIKEPEDSSFLLTNILTSTEIQDVEFALENIKDSYSQLEITKDLKNDALLLCKALGGNECKLLEGFQIEKNLDNAKSSVMVLKGAVDRFSVVSEYFQVNLLQILSAQKPHALEATAKFCADLSREVENFAKRKPNVIDGFSSDLHALGKEELARFQIGKPSLLVSAVRSYFDRPMDELAYAFGQELADGIMLGGLGKLISAFKTGSRLAVTQPSNIAKAGAKPTMLWAWEAKHGKPALFKNADGAANIFQAELLKQSLQPRTMWSIFNPDRTLKLSAINESRIIQDVSNYAPTTPIYMELSKYGNINDWAKYRTQKFHTHLPPNNPAKNKLNTTAEVHFYKNKVTGQVFYDLDYKIKYDKPNNPHLSVDDYLDKLPDDWKPKL